MTYHGILPALDSSGVPATLSPRVLTGLLRDSLGYGGVLITDAMDMAGVLRQFGAAEAARRAVARGSECVARCRLTCRGRSTRLLLQSRRTVSRIENRRVGARLLEWKRHFGLDRARLVNLDSVRAIVGDTTHAAVARRVAERGLVLVKDSMRTVPLSARRSTRVLSITYARRTDLGAGVGVHRGDARAYDSFRTEFVSSDDVAPDFQRLLSLRILSDVVLVGSYVNISSTTPRQVRLVRSSISLLTLGVRSVGAWCSCRSARRICCSRLRLCRRT